jgi:hypothetical protein
VAIRLGLIRDSSAAGRQEIGIAGLLKIGFAVRAEDAVGLQAVAAGEGEVGPPEHAASVTSPTTMHGLSGIGIQTRRAGIRSGA